MDGYPFKLIEPKWRRKWDENDSHKVNLSAQEDNLYVLVMFSYPSEKKLHIGHWWNYSGTDIYARFKKMQGFNVFEPMGFDAFGLPAENYAIKHGVHPSKTTRESIGFIREQLKMIGAMYDWGREVNTSSPDYYRWTQWLFLQLYKHKAAYQKQAPVNWCPQCQTVLANEQVNSDGSCDRCSTQVTVRDLKQWFFKITDFADDLINGLDKLDWPEATKTIQKHWIGRSEGTKIKFKVKDRSEVIECFTTRADTLFGVSYIVLAPEHDLVRKITSSRNLTEVEEYVSRTRGESDINRLASDRKVSGCDTGSTAINPINGKEIPIWIADYVLGSYGTGAVMAVPAHDQRDFRFSSKYNLPVFWVIKPDNENDKPFCDRAFEDYGVLHNSGEFDGLASDSGKENVTSWLSDHDVGGPTVSYRLRDWLISRQRYWGAPIPIIHCDSCGAIPVPEADLPVLLPVEDVDFTPRGTSPLGACDSFINTVCPECGGKAKRDADTMDTFVCSSWYYLRYVSTHMDEEPFDKKLIDEWLPVDVYVGGPEHATGHLIYSRFIAKFLNKIGAINLDEPFKRLIHQGIITQNGHRMSKSKGNVVNPEPFVDKYGSDCFRLYLMFMGDYTVGGDWSDEGIVGIRRFQNRIWRLVKNWSVRFKDMPDLVVDTDLDRVRHYTIKEVSNDIENFQFNTAISRLMELVNTLYGYVSDESAVNLRFLKSCLETAVQLISPLAPHMGEEMWQMLGNNNRVFECGWPQVDHEALAVEEVTIVVQINGKMTDSFKIAKGADKEVVVEMAYESMKVKKHITGRTIRRIIHVPDRILNIVI